MIKHSDYDDAAPVAFYGDADTPCDVPPEVGWFLASVMFEDPVMACLTTLPPAGEAD